MTLYLNPYEVALQYRQKHWFGPIPLPVKQKNPPPLGFTGHAAKFPTMEQIQEWMKSGNHNIGLRIAGVDKDFEVVGIDVDHYKKGDKDKRGGDQLSELEARLGELPQTWTSSSRTDGWSGIRFFRVPRGLAFQGKLGQDIECISKGYRFAVIWPSIHPTGEQYVWFPPGSPLTVEGRGDWDGQIPDALDLPELPEAWVQHVTQGKKLTGAETVKDTNSTVDEIMQWAEDTFHGWGDELCPKLADAVKHHSQKLQDEATSYDVMTDAHSHVIHLAQEGHVGLANALTEISQKYTDVCTDRDKRDNEEQIRGEIFRSITGALRKEKPRCDSRAFVGASPVGVQCDQFGGLCYGNDDDPHTWSPDKHSDQLRMAYRFAKWFRGKLLYVFEVGWHYWDGKRWARDDKGKAHRAVMFVLKKAWEDARLLPADDGKKLMSAVKSCEKFQGMNGMLNIASKLKDFAFTVNDLDKDPYLLNVDNGTLNLLTMEIKPHDPADLITKVCRAAYRPEFISDVWENFLKRVLPNQEVREYLQRLAGVALIGTVREHILAILTGEGRNGKGTWYEAVLYAIGDYGCVAEPDLFMHRDGAHPTGQMDLRGARLVVVSENDRDRRLAEATMKRLTGGDPIKARHMRKDFVTFEPSHLSMLITNHLPRVNGDDPATWARMRVIPFNVVIPPEERDTQLGEKMKASMDAVLTWALIGLERYHVIGAAEPEAVMAATEQYQSDSDDVEAFIRDFCETRPEAITRQATTGELFAAWGRWQRANSCPELGLRAFGKSLDAKGYHTLPVNKDSRKERRGICLRTMRLVEAIAEQS